MRKANNGSSTAAPLRPRGIARRALIASSIAIGCAALAIFLWYSLHVVLLMFAGLLVAIFLHGLALGLAKVTHLGHKGALALVLLLLVLIFGGIGWLAFPKLVDQLGQVGDKVPLGLEKLKEHLQTSKLGAIIVSYVPPQSAFSAWRDNMVGSIGTFMSGIVGAVVTVAVIAFIGLYLAAEPTLYIGGLLRLVPTAQRDRLAEVLGAIGYTLKWWLIGQAIDMVIIGVLTSLAMWWLGVPLPLLIGFLAAVFNFIPNFGPLFSLVPAALMAMTISPSTVVWVIVVFMILQTIEGYVLLPLIQRGAVDIPGALTVSSQVLFALLAGPLGLALAMPLAAASFVAIKMLYVEDMLGDYIDNPAHGDARDEVRAVKKAKREVDRNAENPRS
jgi:predicted PurR-regulated permease PerM